MKYRKTIIGLILAVIALILILETVYKVMETEQVVITQFGKPVGDAKVTPGLKIKVPFIQRVNYFEKDTWNGTEIPIRYPQRTRNSYMLIPMPDGR